jgi:hypothetical protein
LDLVASIPTPEVAFDVQQVSGGVWEAAWEYVVGSFDDALALFESLSRPAQAESPFGFIWRGHEDANWALHSTLYRDLPGHRTGSPSEVEVAAAEAERVKCAREDWMLDRHASGPLSGLELLAALQHMGAHTRMLDFTHNALVALWFAALARDDVDARVFGVDVENTGEGRRRESRQVSSEWARDPDLPWQDGWPAKQQRQAWYWTPHPIEARISRQQGCFLLGRTADAAAERRRSSLDITPVDDETLRRVVSKKPGSGKYPGNLMVLIRVRRSAKPGIRRALERMCGYTRAMMYPDLPGFVAHSGFPHSGPAGT